MNNLASKLRNSVSKAAIAASRVNKKRVDADADAVASRLTKESRGRIGKRDAVDVDKLGAKLAKMPKVDQKTIRAVEARLSPVEAGQLARIRDAKPTAASAAARPVAKANTPPPSAASLRMVTSVEAGEIARRGGDVAAYAAVKQNLTPVQKGEYARMLDANASGVNRAATTSPKPATTNAANLGIAKPLTPTLLNSTTVNNPSAATTSQPPIVTPYAYRTDATQNEAARPLVPGTGSSTPPLLDVNGNPISIERSDLSRTEVQQQAQYTPVYGDGDNPNTAPGVSGSSIILSDGDFILGTPVPGGTGPEGSYHTTIADQLVDDSPHVKTPTGQYDTANGFDPFGSVDASRYPTPEEYRQQFASAPREFQDTYAHPDDYYDYYRAINPQYDPDGTEWRDQGPIALAPPQDLIDKAHSELTADGSVEDLTSLVLAAEPHKFNRYTTTPPPVSDAPETANSGLQAFEEFRTTVNNASPEEKQRIDESFKEGAAFGVGEAVLDTAKGTAQMALSTLQYRADTSLYGYAGDALRGVTGKLPPWLDAFIPSEKRAEETNQYTAQLAENLGAYAVSRAKDPEKMQADFNSFLAENWETLRPGYEAAKAQGPEAEAKWWGEQFGRATVEIGMTVTAVGDVAKVNEAVAGLKLLTLDASAGLTAEKASEVSDSLKAVSSAADLAASSDELSLTSINEMWDAQEELAEFELFEGPNLAKTEEGRKLQAEIDAAQAKVDAALAKGYSLSSPGRTGASSDYLVYNTDYLGRQVTSGPVEFYGVVKVKSAFTNFRVLDPTNPIHTSAIQLKPNEFGFRTGETVTVDDIKTLTVATGTEYALFEREVKDPNGGPSKTQYYVVRGDTEGINLTAKHEELLAKKGYKLVVHSHVSGSINLLKPSQEDIDFLKKLDQNNSLIINSRGRIIQYDQGGNVVRAEGATNAAEFKKQTAEKLQPNYKYQYSGANDEGATFRHTYTTNEKGQVVEVSGNLVDKGNKKRDTGSTGTNVGKKGIKNQPEGENDVGFHLVGDQFLGADAKINFVPGNEALNNGPYKNLENRLRNATKEGRRVEFRIELKYSDDPNAKYPDRPTEITVHYNIYDKNGQPGRWTQESFENKNPADVKKRPPKRPPPSGDDGGGKKPKQPPRDLASTGSEQSPDSRPPFPVDVTSNTPGGSLRPDEETPRPK